MSRFSSGVQFDVDLTGNRNRGNWKPEVIVIHWWGNPATRPTFGGVVNWFKMRSSQVSAHYVVESGRITQMVREQDRAWHAGNDWANKYGIGIEVNPRLSDGDYQTAAELIAEIRKRRGDLPLQPHNRYSATQCPGSLDLARLDREARGSSSSGGSGGSSSSSSSTPARKTTAQLAREVIDGKHGNGDARRRSLGSRYAAVQREVNRLLL